jgi:phosphoglycolate phosphatase-like HAD superfamily hydrolase
VRAWLVTIDGVRPEPDVKSRLVLWDIDHTLLDAAGFGWHAYAVAFADLFGFPLTARVGMAGRTDLAIMKDVLVHHGISDLTLIDRFQEAVVRVATGDRHVMRKLGGHELDGATAALTALAARPDVVSSVLTGNLREVAVVKLAAVGLTEHLDLEVGAYGDAHEYRPDLVEIARQRARTKYGRPFGGDAVVLVGDTPLDVEAGLVAGAAVVGVATGQYSRADLLAAGASVVLSDLADTPDVVAAILTAPVPSSPVSSRPVSSRPVPLSAEPVPAGE